MENEIKTLVNELFNKMNIQIDSIEVENDEKPNIFNLKILTEESWLIIWPHGRNFDSLQNIIKLMCSKKIWEKIKLHMEVNDYMKTKDDRLFEFIKKEVAYAEKIGKDVKLPFYSAYERKKIHWFVSELNKPWISTKSIWEGKERRLYICKETPKLTIDIDGDDI